MIALYDPRNNEDFGAVIDILREHGIELFTSEQPNPSTGIRQILVAEEDLPAAMELLQGLDLGGLRH